LNYTRMGRNSTVRSMGSGDAQGMD